MRRTTALVLLVGLAAAAAPVAHAARFNAKALRSRTFYVVPAGAECGLSTNPARGDPQRSCTHDGVEYHTTILGTTPIEMPALDGVPMALDASGSIEVDVLVRSRATFSYEGPLGVGQAELNVRLTATANGEEVVIGEATESYSVSPASLDYRVQMTIDPEPGLAGAKLSAPTMHVSVTGPTVNHGYIPADASTRITLPLVR